MKASFITIDNDIIYSIIYDNASLLAYEISSGAVRIGTFDKLKKRIRDMLRDFTLCEADRYLHHFGFVLIRQKGSHRICENSDGLIINIQGPILKEYQIRQIINAVENE